MEVQFIWDFYWNAKILNCQTNSKINDYTSIWTEEKELAFVLVNASKLKWQQVLGNELLALND